MLRMIGTLITRITRIFTDFTLFGFLINFVKANNKGIIFIQTKDTHKNCRTFGTKKSVKIRVIRIIRVPILRNMSG